MLAAPVMRERVAYKGFRINSHNLQLDAGSHVCDWNHGFRGDVRQLWRNTRPSTGKHRYEHDSGLPHESFHVHRMNYGKKQVVLYATVPYKNDTSAIVQRITLFCPNREGVTAFIVPYRQKKGRKQTT